MGEGEWGKLVVCKGPGARVEVQNIVGQIRQETCKGLE